MKRRKQSDEPRFKALKLSYAIALIIAGSMTIIRPETLKEMDVMYLIGLATLVVFFYTPFAIVVLQEKSSILFPWDYRVILDTIADLVWNIMLMVGFILLPILFWESLSSDIPWAKPY